MTTQLSRSGPRPAHDPVVRTATTGDADELYRLSRGFAHKGALRARASRVYARSVGDFRVAESATEGVVGCVGLRRHPMPGGDTAVLYNFCVSPTSQGRGVGSALLRATLAAAVAQSVVRVYTATVGVGTLFLRHGFVPGATDGAPAAWLAALDPRRGSQVLALVLTAGR
ncbi:GNAT family N-acetyltransferase [Streptomyces sp. SID8352]|uniref:GNAT family N-acetyltransferase n=1 Tax=Streptomyces sp. SID8352 TaxID=2690338 RepID=UPI00136DA5A4|nr:GNAT family N-acetyltransferase [Streptomyces sp. SID8352]MYU23192.1 GNAT family N-acetyltransferase [Streptomyces sp. SID8352]